jgi:hypothetical protein
MELFAFAVFVDTEAAEKIVACQAEFLCGKLQDVKVISNSRSLLSRGNSVQARAMLSCFLSY